MLRREVGPAELRDLEPRHAGELSALFRSDDHDLFRWLAWEHLADAGAAREFLQGFATGRAEGTRRLLGIWLDDTLVGGTLYPTVNQRHRTAEIGVFLAAPARGRGIVTRAVEVMVDHAFDDLGIRRVEWRCSALNAPSRAIPQRLGFTLEGTLRQAFQVRDDVFDVEMWSLLRDERRA